MKEALTTAHYCVWCCYSGVKKQCSLFGQLSCNMNQWRCHIFIRGLDRLKIVKYVVNLIRHTVFEIDLTYNAISPPVLMCCRLKGVEPRAWDYGQYTQVVNDVKAPVPFPSIDTHQHPMCECRACLVCVVWPVLCPGLQGGQEVAWLRSYWVCDAWSCSMSSWIHPLRLRFTIYIFVIIIVYTLWFSVVDLFCI